MNQILTQQVRRQAAQQHGVVSRPQLLAMGVTERMIIGKLQGGLWSTLTRGIYLVSEEATWKSKLAAAALKLPGGVVSHQSAASLHNISPMGRHLVVVTVRCRTTHEFPGAIVHQSTDLRSDAIETLDGLPVTTVSRTIVDLAALLGSRSLQRLVEDCLVTRRVSLENLTLSLAQLRRRGKPGVEKLGRVLDALGAEPIPESKLEQELLALLDEAGLPIPTLQMPTPWHQARTGRVDLSYPATNLIIEADGRRWHSRDLDFEEDRRRDNLATLAGWRVLRFTWQQVQSGRAQVAASVAEALGLPTGQQKAS